METVTMTHGDGEIVNYETGDHDEVIDGVMLPVFIEKEYKLTSKPQLIDLKGICHDHIYIYKKHGKLIIEYSVLRKGKIITVKST
jgi:hypothetical protein